MQASEIQGILNNPDVLKMAAQKLAKDGVHGDTILAHIGPQEAALLKQRGGAGTINPRSGLPQFYDTGGGSDAEMGKDMGGVDGTGKGNGGQGDMGTTGGDGKYGGASDGTADAASAAAHGGFFGGIKDALSGYLGQNAPPDAQTLGPNPMSAQPNSDTYSGFLGSNGAIGLAGLAGSMAMGPFGGMLAKGAVAGLQGRSAADVATAALGPGLGGIAAGAMAHGVNDGGVGTNQGHASEGGYSLGQTQPDPQIAPNPLKTLTASPLDTAPLAAVPAQSPTFAPMGRLK